MSRVPSEFLVEQEEEFFSLLGKEEDLVYFLWRGLKAVVVMVEECA